MARNWMTSSDASQVSGWFVAAGIITMVLFPFLLPGLLITLPFVLPLALALVPLVPLAAAVLAFRALRRRRRRRRRARRPAGRVQPVPVP